MCSNPQNHVNSEGEYLEFACRVCNQCITARKNDWVARAMAEKNTATQTLAIEFTYRNAPDGSEPDAAKAFNYKDVQNFLKRLRDAYYQKYETRNEIRYIIAGERGSLRGRVHWHAVIFANQPMTSLGEWSDKRFNPLSEPIEKTRIHWSLWDHGFVYLREPDQSGMAYVLKYALKDQFNVVKAKGTMREAGAENHGASYFRMSKKPPIGFRWLQSMCNDWEERLIVPVSLQLRIPDYSGFWYPKGPMRDYLITRLHNINKKRQDDYGRDCPQWAALLASVELNEKDWEGLVYGLEEEQNHDEYDKWQWQDGIGTWESKVRKRCGSPRVCKGCLRGQPNPTRKDYIKWYYAQFASYFTDTKSPQGWGFEQWYRSKKQINPFCHLKDEQGRKDAFEA